MRNTKKDESVILISGTDSEASSQKIINIKNMLYFEKPLKSYINNEIIVRNTVRFFFMCFQIPEIVLICLIYYKCWKQLCRLIIIFLNM